MDDEIKKWLKQAKDAGLSDEKISGKLLADGWDKDNISELLHLQGNQSMEEQNQQQPTPQPINPKKKFYKKWWFWTPMAVVVIVIGGWYVASQFLYPDYSIEHGEILGPIQWDYIVDLYDFAVENNTTGPFSIEGITQCEKNDSNIFLLTKGCCSHDVGWGIYFDENFNSFGGFNAEGWTNVNVSGGNTDWGISSFSGNSYAIANAFSSGEQNIQAWLVTPAINLDGFLVCAFKAVRQNLSPPLHG